MTPRTVITGLRLWEIRIPFKTAFRHASAERAETSGVWVEATSTTGTIGYGESCPRPYVTGETTASATAFVSRCGASICADIDDLASMRTWMALRTQDIDANPAAWCAAELAVLDLLAKESGATIEALLGLPPLAGRFRYTAVVGDADADAFARAVEQYRHAGFTDFKIKLSGDAGRDRAKMAVLRHGDTALRLRVDANNLWERADDAIDFLRELNSSLFAVEEPLRPNRYRELAAIGAALDCKVILDESFIRAGQLEDVLLADAPQRWLLNVRVSKMGGLLRSLAIVDAASREGVGVIVGAQVGETSLLTRAGLTVAAAARDDLVAQEGAFGTFLLARDVSDPPLMFGPGGILDVARHPTLINSGWGIDFDSGIVGPV